MSFESMFRISVQFINDTAVHTNKERLLTMYIERIHTELNISFGVIKHLLTGMNIKLPKKFVCNVCEVDIVEKTGHVKCSVYGDYIHNECSYEDKYCKYYCHLTTPKPKIIIET